MIPASTRDSRIVRLSPGPLLARILSGKASTPYSAAHDAVDAVPHFVPPSDWTAPHTGGVLFPEPQPATIQQRHAGTA